MTENKIGFLFGAGAEVGYGMPTGGNFALEIFRYPNDESKDILKDMIGHVEKGSSYAAKWLPKDYDKKKITAYTRKVFNSIIKDTIRNNKESIINKINDFDDTAIRASAEVFNNGNKKPQDELDDKIYNDLGRNVNEINVNQQISYSNLFKEGDKLFESSYFAALINYYISDGLTDFDSDDKELLGNIIKAILQLHIGALSSVVSNEVEDTVFQKDELNLDIFDDLGGSLSVDYETAGISGLNLLYDRSIEKTNNQIVKLAYRIIEKIYSDVLDYKSLIDSNWHYLYLPRKEWGKFTKIVIFLYTVKSYIEDQYDKLDKSKSGYYSDVKENLGYSVIGTTNYSNFIKEILGEQVTFLNGGINVFYDPYMNTISEENSVENDRHIRVPLLFTQSGTGPLSIK